MAQPGVAQEFSTGFCECCAEPGGCGLCLMTACCGCFVAGKNGEQVAAQGHPGGYWGNCLGAIVPFLNIFCICQQAQKTVEAKGVAPDQVMLALKSCCCGPCQTCQTRREQMLMGKDRGYGPAGEQASAALISNKVPSYASCAFD